MNLSAETVQTVKATVPVLEEHGVAIVEYFYKDMLSENPELLNVFNAANQRSGRQQAALTGAIYAYAANIDNLDALTSTVQRIAYKHVSFNILPEHYGIVGRHLIKAMAHVLGDKASSRILDAWSEAYNYLASLFIDVEKTIYHEKENAEGGWRGTRPFRIRRKEKESDLITSFYLEPVDGKPVAHFYPGQYISIYIRPDDYDFHCIRQYSLSDAPNGKHYRISVKREGSEASKGLISHYLHDSLNVDDIVQLSPPVGDFFLDPEETTPVVLLSGGVGQTPVLSMLNTLTINKSDRPIRYVHNAINSQVHAFGKHTRALSSQHNNIKQFLFYDAPTQHCSGHDFTGSLDMDSIRQDIQLPGAHYYFCGPAGYLSMINSTLKSWGIPESHIHYEIFGPDHSV
ncbi:dihydropteridine reductase [Endozoicomonas montiporae]|uniref:Flavohemoprotein n=2 Tax=Endozoicomonas montiporae TaxID=1027273 RepID=A0A081N4I6_9GAMM|nr:NO-inducible flavohemoprotein [Endozoicomonas montiporae]AMO57780.1 nitric oxide dioxygenase [Endozoicomonas montiporae CL-33]KEQ13359.1 dihydropteridine reductase [Endozoicomonas montiporae]